MSSRATETLSETADRLYHKAGHCNCDLDNWEPERDTGHSWVCRIDKEARRLHDLRDPSIYQPVPAQGEV